MSRRSHGARPPGPHTNPQPGAPLPAPELTEGQCRRCGTHIAGLDGRYACGVCGWVNDHSEGHRRLPRADEDPDRPPAGRRRPRLLPGPQPGAEEPGNEPATGAGDEPGNEPGTGTRPGA
ncbi:MULTISPECIES: hypothetical protein [Streptomyces]|uniref:Uncharacterized protein n=1 Tax=Streptomyces katrae TaxID=68223 RepID=A0A0F4IZR8_9ACTN|nr:hypothetical protein [Streptomyces katrae]KJY26176.1 hypothetical protein VR44_30715 [Streptomyces katrae]